MTLDDFLIYKTNIVILYTFNDMGYLQDQPFLDQLFNEKNNIYIYFSIYILKNSYFPRNRK